MKFENTEVWGFKHGLRGMRNPKESWDKSDSYPSYSWDKNICGLPDDCDGESNQFHIGENDMKLAQTLIRAGSEHRKFLRQIFVSVDITAPLYWWKEFDTYKVGTVANSTSTMHKMASKPITLDCFEIDDYDKEITYECQGSMWLPVDDKDCWCGFSVEGDLIPFLEKLRVKHLEYIKHSKNPQNTDAERKHFQRIAKKYWKELIRWLPESWLQTRTVTMNYENLLGICSKGQRRFHKLNEWSGQDNPNVPNFISWARTLPYAQEFIFIDELED